MRFALINMQVGLASILSEYQLLPVKETPAKVNFTKKTFLLASDVGLPILYKKLPSAAA